MQLHIQNSQFVNPDAPEVVKGRGLSAAVPRVVDAYGLPHMRASKAMRACDGADVIDGLAVLGNPTLKLVAVAYGVSIGSLARALRLAPEQRQAVRQGKRPLVLPRKPSVPPAPSVPATLPASPVLMGARERLNEIVAEIGLSATLEFLAAVKKVAA